jgi:DNA-binding NarL/FixJ family response regulator
MTRGLALIADPSQLFCEGLRRLLRQERFSVCAEGRDVAEALTRLDGAVDLTLVICTLDTEACQQNIMQLAVLRSGFPATKIIVITDTTLPPSLWRYGILGFDLSLKVIATAKPAAMVSNCPHPALIVLGPGGL